LNDPFYGTRLLAIDIIVPRKTGSAYEAPGIALALVICGNQIRIVALNCKKQQMKINSIFSDLNIMMHR
jgi:hypothetical protein